MTSGWVGFLGGVGLFLFGMMVMTEALKTLASGRTRAVLARFTTTPLRGVVTGAISTALLQSSSATILTVIGFVGAGLLTFPQAVGVIFGANVGSTATGWVVAVVGLKLRLGVVAMPLLFLGALLAALSTGNRRQLGLAVTGFSLVFLGLEVMQTATEAFSAVLDRSWLPGDSWGGRIAMVLIGAAVTTVIQSSGAGVAAALVLLSGGSIGLMQAAALVIGMDLGTTVKSVIATLGGSRDMRRTAAAHVGYNLVTDLLAFLALPLVPLLLHATAGDAPTALVAFHTLFNIAGVMVMLPFIRHFADVIQRLIPSDTGPLPEPLDRRLLSDPNVAHDAARAAAATIATVQFRRLARSLRDRHATHIGGEPALILATEDLEDFLAHIPLPADGAVTRNRHAALLHLTDHLHRLEHRATQHGRPATLKADPVFHRPLAALIAALERAGQTPTDAGVAAQLSRLHRLLTARTARLRRAILLREHVGMVSPQEVFERTDALRWLERAIFHTERIVHYGAVAATAAPSKDEAAGVMLED